MRIPALLLFCGCGAVFFLAEFCGAQVVISEIMYNPDSFEGRPPASDGPDDPGVLNVVEWVELYNLGGEPVDLSGWTLVDEDGTTGPIAQGAVIEPGAAVVIASSEITEAQFHAAWGLGYRVYTVTGWGDDGLYNLSNAPSEANEILSIVDATGNSIDIVNYDDEGDWPSDRPDGSSIYLPPDVIDALKNDEGYNWRLSEPGVHGAKNNKSAEPFTGIDCGSPGKVEAGPG